MKDIFHQLLLCSESVEFPRLTYLLQKGYKTSELATRSSHVSLSPFFFYQVSCALIFSTQEIKGILFG